ncbi:MAG: hypothetical protein A2381_11590 [Bdellovibrionales bacterium RIFOXYB1_FULL_37_110]|nr:MAG: hypothetical protein A2417_11895 [Bdellovibrionales bacterium RIFOXYC1_FULL_37_79]OFZ57333.1 MAG: hypothetical protein A2381_11590 [Bdellovibrionales bacterium RIFOXYB1_FULL_37_110]OFZ62229.1 MAG: hypothetical protein A2577_14140 [Bdellovibrionales bacterium RIFOXYD1_FULL_36_51]
MFGLRSESLQKQKEILINQNIQQRNELGKVLNNFESIEVLWLERLEWVRSHKTWLVGGLALMGGYLIPKAKISQGLIMKIATDELVLKTFLAFCKGYQKSKIVEVKDESL